MTQINKINWDYSDWSLEAKVAQLFVLAFPGKDARVLEPILQKYPLGGCYLSQDNAETLQEAVVLNQQLQEFEKDYCRSIPLLRGVDQEGAWGVCVPQSTTGPGNLALGRLKEGELTREMYKIMAEEMNSLGYNCILGPCADVNSNRQNTIIDSRSFGEIPEKVALHCKAAVEGLSQGNSISALKHFPGHGDAAEDSHRELPRVDKSLETLMTQELLPFQQGIEAGADMVMTAHIMFPQLDPQWPATLSEIILQQILRDRLGFNGVILSDSMNMGAMRRNYDPVKAAIRAIKAGVDMVMLSEEHYDHDGQYLPRQIAILEGTTEAVRLGGIPLERIHQALDRIIGMKIRRLSKNTELIRPKTQREKAVIIASQCISLELPQDRSEILPEKQGIILSLMPGEVKKRLVNHRGIGPNQHSPASELFAKAMAGPFVHRSIVMDQDMDGLDQHDVIIAVQENYTLPADQCELEEQQRRLAYLQEKYGNKVLLLAFRNDYNREACRKVERKIWAYSSRPCAVQAVVDRIKAD